MLYQIVVRVFVSKYVERKSRFVFLIPGIWWVWFAFPEFRRWGERNKGAGAIAIYCIFLFKIDDVAKLKILMQRRKDNFFKTRFALRLNVSVLR